MIDTCVDDTGAVGDGVALDTAAIQTAIDRTAAAGGGRVSLTPGKTYRAGSISLRSNIDLHIPGGATLLASADFGDYTVIQHGVVQMDEPASAHSSVRTASFLFAADEQNVSISGSGVIDGNGRSYVVETGDEIHVAQDERAFTVHLRDCRRVSIRDVRIVDGALWTLRLSRCDDVVVHAITIDNDVRMPNSDGIDIDACRRVRISDCDVRAGDDAICLKAAIESTRDGRVCEDIVITGCTLTSSSTAVLCGVECDTAIQDVIISGCVITSSNRGLAVSLHERGSIRRVRFENIVVNTGLFDERWWGRGEPVYVAAAARSTRVGTVSDVSFRGITATSPRGVFIYGAQRGAVTDIEVADLTLSLTAAAGPDPTRADYADIRPVPQDGIFVDPVAAVRIHGADGVTLTGVRVTGEDPRVTVTESRRVMLRDLNCVGLDPLSQ